MAVAFRYQPRPEMTNYHKSKTVAELRGVFKLKVRQFGNGVNWLNWFRVEQSLEGMHVEDSGQLWPSLDESTSRKVKNSFSLVTESLSRVIIVNYARTSLTVYVGFTALNCHKTPWTYRVSILDFWKSSRETLSIDMTITVKPIRAKSRSKNRCRSTSHQMNYRLCPYASVASV